jgi:hypothetical protein
MTTHIAEMIIEFKNKPIKAIGETENNRAA